jgi:hypothetical protein
MAKVLKYPKKSFLLSADNQKIWGKVEVLPYKSIIAIPGIEPPQVELNDTALLVGF